MKYRELMEKLLKEEPEEIKQLKNELKQALKDAADAKADAEKLKIDNEKMARHIEFSTEKEKAEKEAKDKKSK